MKDEKALTAIEFKAVMRKIERQHSFGKHGHTNCVKYVRPSFDMRDGKCFHIQLDNQVFDSSDSEKPLIDAIFSWLDRKTEKK